jgi:predicted dehydrogenase
LICGEKMESPNNLPLRLAVIGFGKMGMLHASILNVMENVKVVGICEKSYIIRRLAKQLLKDTEIVGNVGELVDLDLDAVFVTTPIPTHFSLCKMIYEGKIASHFFVEKTLASDFSQAKELCEFAKCSGGVNMVGYMKRFSVTFSKVKELLGQGTIGELSSFSAYSFSSDFAEIQTKSKKSGSRGGVLNDLGSHVVDLALWYFDSIEVENASLKVINSSGCEDEAKFEVTNDDGFKGNFHVSWCKNEYRMPEFGFEIRGTRGELKVNDDLVELNLRNGEHKKWYKPDLNDCVDFLLGAPEYYREDKHFSDSVLARQNVENDFCNAARVDDLLEQVKRKAKWQ